MKMLPDLNCETCHCIQKSLCIYASTNSDLILSVRSSVFSVTLGHTSKVSSTLIMVELRLVFVYIIPLVDKFILVVYWPSALLVNSSVPSCHQTPLSPCGHPAPSRCHNSRLLFMIIQLFKLNNTASSTNALALCCITCRHQKLSNYTRCYTSSQGIWSSVFCFVFL